MIVENTMYVVLGGLIAGLLALMIIPLISRRAARLTRKRIEAATPITLTEFKADKDQLRAEFAMSTRRLEMNVDTLRNRLTDQLNEINTKKANINELKNQRYEQTIIVHELEDREEKLRKRILELEKDASIQAQKLRARDRELADNVKKLSKTQTTLSRVKKGVADKIEARKVDTTELSGNYAQDMDELSTLLDAERRRADFLEEQVERLAKQAAENGERAVARMEKIDDLKGEILKNEDIISETSDDVSKAEAQIANAESRLNALLQQTDETLSGADKATKELSVQNTALESELIELRDQIAAIEDAALTDWDSERLEQSFMRERLNDIASSVSKLINEVDNDTFPDSETSLFERVRQYAEPANGKSVMNGNGADKDKKGDIASRMAALRDAQATT